MRPLEYFVRMFGTVVCKFNHERARFEPIEDHGERELAERLCRGPELFRDSPFRRPPFDRFKRIAVGHPSRVCVSGCAVYEWDGVGWRTTEADEFPSAVQLYAEEE